MENASKALIFAGSILVSIMIIAVGVRIFQSGRTVSDVEYTRSTTAEIQSFNAQFSIYETAWTYGNSFSESTKRTDDGTPVMYLASSSLNTISDVISAVNKAASVNYQNNYGYKYYANDYVETINAVEVIVDMSTNTPSGLYKYYLIEPNASVNSNYIYGTNSLSSTELTSEARATRISNFTTNFSSYTEVSCNSLLSALNETKLVQYNNSNYTLYKYYFEGTYSINEDSGLINSVKFTLVCNTDFDDL